MNEVLRARILELMNRHGIGHFAYDGPDGALTLDTDLPEQEHPPILAQAPGIFLSRHPAEQREPVWPRRVADGDIIGWLRVGPVLMPVRAAAAALVRRPRLVDGTPAGFGERLF